MARPYSRDFTFTKGRDSFKQPAFIHEFSFVINDVSDLQVSTDFIPARLNEVDYTSFDFQMDEARKSAVMMEVVNGVDFQNLSLGLVESSEYDVLEMLVNWSQRTWNDSQTVPKSIRGTVNPPAEYWKDAHLDLLRTRNPQKRIEILGRVNLHNIFPISPGESDYAYSDDGTLIYNVEFSVESVSYEFF